MTSYRINSVSPLNSPFRRQIDRKTGGLMRGIRRRNAPGDAGFRVFYCVEGVYYPVLQGEVVD
jgi:hypothetical protein